MEERKYGKFTVDQLRLLIDTIPMLEAFRAEMMDALSETRGSAGPWLKPGLAWAAEYEYAVEVQLARLAVLMGEGQTLNDAANSDDPLAVLSKMVDRVDNEDFHMGQDAELEPQILLGRLLGVLATFECLMLYGYYINELLVLAKDNGDDKALLNAIRVDPVVVTCEFAAHRISTAVAVGDSAFLKGLQNAMLGKTGDQARFLKEFRVLMQLLQEIGMLERPTSELSSLCVEVGAYKDHPNAEKNLSELIRKFRKL